MKDELFTRNRAWARSLTERDPEFFKRLSKQQAPQFLWIGCSDSRVPANDIVGLLPGELFVHRNVANVVVHADLNCLSVIQFAIEVLAVTDVIVCGHYGCGGVRAAIDGGQHGLIDNWLRHVQDVARAYAGELDALPTFDDRVDRLCELNVGVQARNVAHTTVVQDAWRRGQAVSVHGWIYDVGDGLLQDLGVRFRGPEDLRRNSEFRIQDSETFGS